MGFYDDIWQSEQAGISFSGFNRGASIYFMREKTFKKQKFGIAAGIGFGSHNLYSDGLLTNEFDNTGKPTGNIIFNKIPDSIDYKTNKLSVTYLDIPIEIRFHPKEKIKVAAGFKAGILVNSHLKYTGKDLSGSGDDVKNKSLKVKNTETLRYGITGRIGYKEFSISFFYSLSNVFESGKGPELYPISIGLTYVPF